MTSLRFESPLAWPEWMPATPRTGQRRDHGFTGDITIESSITYLDQEVEGMAASGVLSLDIEHPNVERLRQKVGSRTGACLRLRYQHVTYVIACDRWQNPEHNIYALHLALRQWRNMERWGIAPLAALLSGFEQGAAIHHTVAASPAAIQPWMDELGLGPTSTLDDAVAVYHRRAKSAAQNADALSRLNILMEEVRAYFASKGNA